MITQIYIGSDKLDLFESDNIELKSSIVEVQDVAKIFTDSTNSFSVPATENNNKIFKHFYNANIVNGWDVFNKVDATIELYGFLHKQGKIQLNNVITKSQVPTSYDIQFYGLLTSLKDLLGDDKLSSLDMSAYNFNQTASTASTQLQNYVAPSPDIVRTTLSTRRMIYDSDSSTNNTEDIKNVANNNTGYNSGMDWSKTSVSIKNIRIIEAIESKYGITFSRDYFGKNEFTELYLLLNGNGVESQIEQQVVFDSALNNDPTLENDRILLSTNLPFSSTGTLRISINCEGANRRDEFTSCIKANGKEIHSVTANGNEDGLYVYLVKKTDFPVFENLTFHFKSASILDYKFTVDRQQATGGTAFKSERDLALLEGVFDVSNNMPDLKILDYLKGFFQKDKLVAINTSETDIFIDSLNQYYRSGQVKEITKYVDFSEIPISTGKIFNEINYKFKEPNTILQKEFFKTNNIYYGDLEFKLVDANGKLVEGESIDIELPFENMIYERLQDVNGVDDVNFQYGFMANESLEPVNVKAHLHYVQRLLLTSGNYVKLLTGTSSFDVLTTINVPIRTLGLNTPQYSTTFGEEFNEYNGNLIVNTIFSNYHEDYINEAFNSQKRLYKIKCKNLPIDFLLNLKLNDVLEIKEQYYRINKYKLNLINKEVDFELYNIKNLDLTPSVNITWDNANITWDSTLITFDQT
jgi:hypothetical protein